MRRKFSLNSIILYAMAMIGGLLMAAIIVVSSVMFIDALTKLGAWLW